MRYNCAVIGLGNIGSKFSLDPKRKGTWTHVEAYKKCIYTKLVGTVEIASENIQIFESNNPDIPVYNTIRDLFSNHRIDLVSICVPTKEHFSVFSEVVNCGPRAIFCEKPLSGSLADSKKMVNLAQKKNLTLTVNYLRRWQSSYNLVSRIIDSGKIGEIKSVNSYYPGHIYTMGSHLFDTLLMLVKFIPTMVSAANIQDSPDPSISGWFILKHNSNGIFASFSATGRREDLIFEIDIIGDEGRLRISDNGYNIELFLFEESKRYSGYRELALKEIKQPHENDRFVDAVLDIVQVLDGKRERVKCSGEDALFVDEMIEMAVTSARENRVLTRGREDKNRDNISGTR